MVSRILPFLLSGVLLFPVPGLAADELTGDTRYACEALLCLSSGIRPGECSASHGKNGKTRSMPAGIFCVSARSRMIRECRPWWKPLSTEPVAATRPILTERWPDEFRSRSATKANATGTARIMIPAITKSLPSLTTNSPTIASPTASMSTHGKSASNMSAKR